MQLMLCANGRTVAIDGKCSGGLINAIKSFQKSKLGYKKPDGVVDPGGKTWNAGAPKLNAQIAADKAACEDMVVLMVNGKEKRISKALYKKNQQELRSKVVGKARMMKGQADSWSDFCYEAERMSAGADGLAMAAVSFIVATVKKKANPPHAVVDKARGSAAELLSMASNPATPWTKIQAQDTKATKAYNDGVVAFKAFIDARVGTASAFVGKLE
ncbi:MAG: peptidoglycan-binding protein, partial [Pseudomonadota bacterium]